MGWLSSLFGETIEIEYRDEQGRLVKKRVSKKQFDEFTEKALAEGKATIYEGCDVHIIDPDGYRVEKWIVGKDIEQENYDKYKDKNGFIYVMIHYENGEPNTTLLKREIWQQIKEAT
jgi:diphthamide synthase (EF-2-diphthine--ammonia ligase)